MEDYKQCLGIVLMFSVVSLVLSVNAANLEYQGCTQAWFISNVPTIRGLCICYSTLNRGAEYCDEHVCTYMCVCVCLSAIPYLERHVRSSPDFLYILPMAVARSSSGGVLIRYVLLVLWMTYICS